MLAKTRVSEKPIFPASGDHWFLTRAIDWKT
jgi:hypothetical protein